MQVNAVKCTTGKKWIHERCNDIHGNLSLVVDGFRCKPCDCTIP